MPITHGVLVRHYTPHPALGRHQVLDARSLAHVRRHRGEALRPVHWQPAIPVLNQQDLYSQSIRTSTIVPGAPDVDALGSCTANAAAVALSVLLAPDALAHAGLPTNDAAQAERWAIGLYTEATALDEFVPYQWPPADSGSSGLGTARALKARGLIGSYTHALDADALAAALQDGPVLLGLPWFNAWFTPGRDGFVDAVPYWRTSGLAGGHEVCAIGLEDVAQYPDGRVIPERTVLRLRNSWSPSWGHDGDFFLRLSTYVALREQIDAIQLHA
ncbi:hypothetical protein HUT19_41750 (plasmid) [Streptomyces sp. NA02950]|uniref:hypothetical protein n=1 Tax=Streptomyces sp. NA02950 TaxID=2742137 RepID=UPI0015909F68|nr:hypothetical protein [Streptomyces sp. NA02950]QKV98246.1 hypothetical protein HUT19_41750 [Streptomyces sp. NA02950]